MTSPPPVDRDGPPRVRHAFLDGFRGLASVAVLLHHAILESPASGQRRAAALLRGAIYHLHYAVAVFIVLSGFCLMLPVVRSGRDRLPGGFLAYLGRRARRILPPYYAALIFSWLLIAAVPVLRHPSGVRWDAALPATSAKVVATHLLLVHNLDLETVLKVDPPMWSVATEWQIYLLMPALLFLRSRQGIAATVAAGLGIGWGLAALATSVGNPALWLLSPWFLGLFAMGMAAAVASESPAGVRRARLWPAIAWSLLALAALLVLTARKAIGLDRMVLDPIIGAATALLLWRCAARSARGESSAALRLLESRGAAALGSCSYSLYLTHYPLLALAGWSLRARGVGPGGQLAALLLVASPLCILAAALFARVVERPFLPGHRASPPRGLRADAAHPTPASAAAVAGTGDPRGIGGRTGLAGVRETGRGVGSP